MAETQQSQAKRRPNRTRTKQFAFYLSDEEAALLRTVPVRERSSFVRETLLSAIKERQEKGAA